MMVDGRTNSVYEVNTVAARPGPDNPHSNAFRAEATLLATEAARAARRPTRCAAASGGSSTRGPQDRLGEPVAYRLCPARTCCPSRSRTPPCCKRAGFMTQHLWVTPHDPRERYPAGDYPNQHPGGDGLPGWTRGDRRSRTRTWCSGTPSAHITSSRPEDWPVMPVMPIGFMLKPDGFFDRNPALDVPPPTPHCCAPGG